MHGAVGRRADAAEDQQHLVALDQPPGLLHRLRRAVGIVGDDHLDAPAVDAAVVVDLAEIGLRRFRDLREGGDRAAQRRRGADLDGLVVGAGIVFRAFGPERHWLRAAATGCRPRARRRRAKRAMRSSPSCFRLSLTCASAPNDLRGRERPRLANERSFVRLTSERSFVSQAHGCPHLQRGAKRLRPRPASASSPKRSICSRRAAMAAPRCASLRAASAFAKAASIIISPARPRSSKPIVGEHGPASSASRLEEPRYRAAGAPAGRVLPPVRARSRRAMVRPARAPIPEGHHRRA